MPRYIIDRESRRPRARVRRTRSPTTAAPRRPTSTTPRRSRSRRASTSRSATTRCTTAGNGLFVARPSRHSRDILVEGNCDLRQRQRRQHLRAQHLHRGARHHLSVQPLRAAQPGAGGNNLKDRSAGWSCATTGSRAATASSTWSRPTASTIRNDPPTDTTFVYGNVLIEPDAPATARSCTTAATAAPRPTTARARCTSTTTRWSRTARTARRCCASRPTRSAPTCATTSSTSTAAGTHALAARRRPASWT